MCLSCPLPHPPPPSPCDSMVDCRPPEHKVCARMFVRVRVLSNNSRSLISMSKPLGLPSEQSAQHLAEFCPPFSQHHKKCRWGGGWMSKGFMVVADRRDGPEAETGSIFFVKDVTDPWVQAFKILTRRKKWRFRATALSSRPEPLMSSSSRLYVSTVCFQVPKPKRRKKSCEQLLMGLPRPIEFPPSGTDQISHSLRPQCLYLSFPFFSPPFSLLCGRAVEARGGESGCNW